MLIASSTAATAPALAASKLSVSYPRSAVLGTTITIAGSTKVSRATRVSVQRPRGRSWQQLASAKLRGKKFSVKLKLAASTAIGTTRFRVVARRGSKTLAKSRTLSIKVVAPTIPGSAKSVPVDDEGGRGSLGGDYPDADAVDCSAPPPRGFGIYSWCKNGTWLSPRGYGYRNCTDYAAWVLGLPRGLGDAKRWKANASKGGLTVTNSASVGDVAWWWSGDEKEFGHVAVVTAVYPSGAVDTVDYNGDGRGNKTIRSQTRATKYLHPARPPAVVVPGSGADGGSTGGVSPGQPVLGTPGTLTNGSVISMAGHWVDGDSGQDFAYVTKSTGGGFDVAVFAQTASGLQWQGVWWSLNGSSGVTFENTVFVPVQNPTSGLMDLYYATATDWMRPGFALGLMRNTGHGFQYAGTQWAPDGLKLGETRFIPGTWSTAGPGFAYVTKNNDNGFSVASFASTAGGLQWQGVSWTQPGSSGVQYGNTRFVPIKANGNGLTDLFYATSTNWENPGFALGQMKNTGSGLEYAGTAWSEPSIPLSKIRFLPGYWQGGSREGLGYVTPNGDNGYSFATFASTPAGLQWRGVWWSQAGSTGVQYGNTVFVPADVNGDGTTDLGYATSTNWTTPGFVLGLMQNNGGVSLTYAGTQWNASGIPLGATQFVPSG